MTSGGSSPRLAREPVAIRRCTAVARAGRAVEVALAAIESALVERRTKSGGDHFHYPVKLDNKLSLLMGVVATGDGRPTAQSRAVYRDLTGRIDKELAGLDRILSSDLPALNELAVEQGLPRIVSGRPSGGVP